MNTANRTLPINPAPPMAPPMVLALSSSFTSVERWRESFVAMAKAHAGDPGRLELAFVPDEATLRNRWTTGESSADATTILAMQMPADADAFIAGIDWPQAYQRYTDAVHAASEPFAAYQGDVSDALLLDVRRAGVFEAANSVLPGATWRDPAAVRDWAGQLPAGREVIVYCVYGHEVGRVTAMRLRAQGVNARYLSGGIDGWQSAGRRTVPKGDAS